MPCFILFKLKRKIAMIFYMVKWESEKINQTNERSHFLPWHAWTFCQRQDKEAEETILTSHV